jgi:biotin synthase
MNIWKWSAGTAAVVANPRKCQDNQTTTAYILLGDKCHNNCKFCSQARLSQGNNNRLSRIIWPDVPVQEAAAGIGQAYGAGRLHRACIQLTADGRQINRATDALTQLQALSQIPVCVASHIQTRTEVQQLLAAGADRVCLALDAATPAIYHQVKEGDWTVRRQLLAQCGAAFPGKITTHLMVGLGETEAEMVNTMASCLADNITVALFAFTPVVGTALEARPAPLLSTYRRIQMVHYLLKQGYSSDIVQYDQGRIVKIFLPDLVTALDEGAAFQTSGCPDCNRPFYNERPGGPLYNYPRPLTAPEFAAAIVAADFWEAV